jgi:hypothetical protein
LDPLRRASGRSTDVTRKPVSADGFPGRVEYGARMTTRSSSNWARRFAFSAVLLAIAACGPTGGGAQDSGAPPLTGCAAHTSCASCSDLSGCGWCGTTHTCLAGTSSGSTDGSCTGTVWATSSGLCTTADPGYRCNAPGEHCGGSLDCCGAGGFCATSTKTCDSTSCVAVAGQCGRDVECCSGHCQTNHQCAQ